MSTAVAESALESLQLLQGLLECLLYSLSADAGDGHDPAALQPLLAESASQASAAQLPAVARLLRIWATAMTRCVATRRRLGAHEQAALHGWFAKLTEYCGGRLGGDGPRDLLDELSRLTKGAALPPALHAEVEAQLQAGSAWLRQLLEVPASDVAVAAPADSGADPAPIWISAEELGMALDALAGQILPGIQALADAADREAQVAALAELEFHLGLVGNAMEMLGTPVLSRGILALQEHVASPAPPAAELLLGWSASLAALLDQPGVENAELLAAIATDIGGADANWGRQLCDEWRRIRVGSDPTLVALRKSVADAADIDLQPAADVLPNVLDGMLRELPGNAARLGSALRRLVASGDIAPLDEARRVAHTLKGDANTVGIAGLANLTHSLEDLLVELGRSPERLQPELGEALGRAADCVEEIADHVLGRGPRPDHLLEVYQSILDWSNALVGGAAPVAAAPMFTAEVPDDPVSPAATPSVAPVMRAPPAQPMQSSMPAPAAADALPATRTASLTVSAELLDELQRLSGETLVMARQIDQRLARLEDMHREQVAEARNSSGLLGKLDDLISLRGAALQSTALRGAGEVDPLELDQYAELHVVSRRLLESSADNGEYQRRLDALLADMEGLRSEQEAVHADLQRLVQRARMVPFEQIGGRLQRIVRQTARELNRVVELSTSGADTLVDADLLDRIVEPLAHLLRNAIDHGIEDADVRVFAGKPASGNISLSVANVADSIEIRVADDGQGLDYDAIRRKAIRLGLLDAEREAGDDELARLILMPGFTTRQQVTQVSGRGIGMDVVQQRIVELRGQLGLASVAGQGLTVSVRLPVSQTMANVIIAHGHDLILAAVAGSVERVINLPAEDLAFEDDGQVRLRVDGTHLPIVPVESLYGRAHGRLSLPTANGLGLVVSSARGKRVIVSVGGVDAVSNVIVKPVSPFLPPVPAVRGMTLLGDGRLAAVVDMDALIDGLDAESDSWRIADLAAPMQLPRVVVADDSLSVRRALGQLMEDAGFEVSTARDGLEALELINAMPPALVLLDLEMPRLNGLEVTRFMRNRAPTREVPVLMISSRAGDKYRAQAEEAGVTLMLGKPVTEDDLIATVRRLLSAPATLVALETA